MDFYVDRDVSNVITGLYRLEQYPGQERLPDTDPEVIAYFTAKDLDRAKADKIALLKEATIDQFKFLLELFRVGKANGLWANADFDPELLAKGQEWIQLINDIES